MGTPETGGVTGVLTDSTGVSSITGSKFFKDLILDFLITAPATFVVLSISSLEQALTAPIAVGLGLLDAGIRVLYRGALRWAQSDTIE